jgi:beta-aspartyl-peptidase (threonine type)
MKKIIVMNCEGWPGISSGIELLQKGGLPLDALEQAIKFSEKEVTVRSVGYGGAPNALGVMQLDASIMNGDTLQAGSVGALEGIMHPISVAREILKRLPHVMLVGEGAQRFALECGFKKEEILSAEAKKEYLDWQAKHFKDPLISIFNPEKGDGSHGTVIGIARDGNGSFGGGVSTSGWDYKYPGRLGDSPVIGAGMYVDSRYGGAACTNCGESAIRTSLARSVVLYMKKGASVRDAVAEGMEDLKGLKGGYQGQVVIYAVDKEGNYFVARRYEPRPPRYCEYLVWCDGMEKFERKVAEFLG